MSSLKVALLNAAFLVVYFAAGKFGLAFFGLIHPSAAAVWLPTGVAMAAFAAGYFGNAERLLAAFERAHPADARVEDATFLRAVARARRGDLTTARAIADEYLRRYPNGLRRAEAERMLH